jgi:DNA-binding NtrC family response regulator
MTKALPLAVAATNGRAAVLLLEDNAAMRMVCRVNLEIAGYRVVEAETVEEAERLLSTETIRVVVTDLQITKPGDGLRFAAQARADYPEVGLVLMTGTTGGPDEPLAFADAYYVKPFDLDDFLVSVKQLAQRNADEGRCADRRAHAGS